MCSLACSDIFNQEYHQQCHTAPSQTGSLSIPTILPDVPHNSDVIRQTTPFCSSLNILTAAGKPMPLSKDGNAEMHILPVPLTLLSAISTLRVSIPADLRPPEARRATLLTLKVLMHFCQHFLWFQYCYWDQHEVSGILTRHHFPAQHFLQFNKSMLSACCLILSCIACHHA